MSIKLSQVHEAYQMASSHQEWYTAKLLLGLIVQGLGQQMSAALGFVLDKGRITAPELAEAHGYRVNHANNILKRLYSLSLLRREQIIDEAGLHYVWWLADDVLRVFGETIKTGDKNETD